MKRFFSILRDVAFVIFVLFICGMIFIMSTGKHFSVAGYQVLRVLTSSMEPAIAENTCIIIKEYPVDRLKVGDIITFTSDDPQIQGYYNTHRIHDIVEENGETLFLTKGDATSAVDAYPVHKDQVAGIFVKELPGGRTLGKMFLALSDNKVYFLVIMLPLALCLMSYFWQIVGMVTGRYDEDEEEEDYKVIDDELDDILVYADGVESLGVEKSLDVAENLDVAKTPDVAKTSNVVKSPDVANTSEVAENPDMAQSIDVTETSNMMEFPNVVENPDMAESIDVTETSNMMVFPNVVENPDMAESMDMTEYPDEMESPDIEKQSLMEVTAGQEDNFGVGGNFDNVRTSGVEKVSDREGVSGMESRFGMENTFGLGEPVVQTGTSGIETNSGIDGSTANESMLQTENIPNNISTIISDSEIEAILAEAASKIEDRKIEPEKARIDRIVEDLTSNSVSDELVEKKREMLRAEYKKINKNYAKSDAE